MVTTLPDVIGIKYDFGGFMVTTMCVVGGFRVTTMPDVMALFEM